MKRFKDLLLSLFIFGSIVVIIFILLSFLNIRKTIYISENATDETKYNDLKSRINALNEGDCKNFLNDYVEYTDKGNFVGNIDLKEVYDYFWQYPSSIFYDQGKTKCNITDEEIKEYGFAGKYITVLALPDAIFDKYMFAHELNLKDSLRRSIEPNIDSVLYASIRFNQLEILEDYVTLAEMKEGTHE